MNNKVMFPGSSCFPLSPCDMQRNDENKNKNIISNKDQMKVILQKVKKVNEEDLSFINADEAVNYIKTLQGNK